MDNMRKMNDIIKDAYEKNDGKIFADGKERTLDETIATVNNMIAEAIQPADTEKTTEK